MPDNRDRCRARPQPTLAAALAELLTTVLAHPEDGDWDDAVDLAAVGRIIERLESGTGP